MGNGHDIMLGEKRKIQYKTHFLKYIQKYKKKELGEKQ